MLRIIIPNYNKAPYLKELLDSLAPQMTEEDQIIFVDDNSTDNSIEIVKEHPLYKNHLFLVENKGKRWWCAKARNLGMEYVEDGDWFCFIDSDDFASSSFIQTLHSYMKEQKALIYCYKCKIIDINSKTSEVPLGDRLAVYTRLYHSSIVGAIHFSEDYKYKEAHCGEDMEFTRRAVAAAGEVIYKDDVLYNYRLGVPGGESSLSGMAWETKKDYWEDK